MEGWGEGGAGARLDPGGEGGAEEAAPERRGAEHEERERRGEEEGVHLDADGGGPEERGELPAARLGDEDGHVDGEHRDAVVKEAEDVD